MSQISVLYNIDQANSAERFIQANNLVALEMTGIDSEDAGEDIEDYIRETQSDYLYLFDADYVSGSGLLLALQEELGQNPGIDIAVSPHRFADESYQLIAPPYRVLGQALFGGTFSGDILTDIYSKQNINLIGGTGCCLFKKSLFLNVSGEKIKVLLSNADQASKQIILKKLFQGAIAKFLDKILVVRIGKKAATENLKKAYEKWYFTQERKPLSQGAVKKEITFFYMDHGERHMIQPIAHEAEKRGYKIIYTENLKQKAEIGVYCQHVCYPENSAFSVVLLHDLLQDYEHWPNLWEVEPWGGFDIGILPGEDWAERWKKCGALHYANPRRGIYVLGYPKSDAVTTSVFEEKVKKLKDSLGMKYDHTVLYAPSWENDGKEDEFIKALVSLPINLMIKQAHWNEVYDYVIKSIKEMRALHEGKYDNVYYVDPKEDIMVTLGVCDIVVSEESNVLLEAALCDKLGIAVDDWRVPGVPGVKKPGLASFPGEYALHCTKSELRSTVESCIKGEVDSEPHIKKVKRLFSNQGKVCEEIVDAIDYFTGYGIENGFLKKRLLADLLPFD